MSRRRGWAVLAFVTGLLASGFAGLWLLNARRTCVECVPVKIVNLSGVEVVHLSITHLGNDIAVARMLPGEVRSVWLGRLDIDGKSYGKSASVNANLSVGGAFSASFDLPETPKRIWIAVKPGGGASRIVISYGPWWLP